ncbi:universal stress protein [Halostagnicola bangensis]
MENVLIVQTGDAIDETLFKTAAEHVTGTEKEVLVCVSIDADRIQNELKRQARPDRTLEEIKRTRQADAADLADEVFGSDIPYTVREVVGRIPDDVLEIAAERECDHIFVSGKGRSPAGKAIFGDVAQSVILEFDGPVTVLTS